MKYYIGDIPYGDKELYHFGVKGMKWGVRRYQNEDGTLTAAGKERYAKKEAKYWNKDGSPTDAGYKRNSRLEKQAMQDAQSVLDEFEQSSGEKRAAIMDKLIDRHNKYVADNEQFRERNHVGFDDPSYYEFTENGAYETGYDIQVYSHLMQKVNSESVDWYIAKPVTKGAKQILDRINHYRDEAYRIEEEYDAKFKPEIDAAKYNYAQWNKVRDKVRTAVRNDPQRKKALEEYRKGCDDLLGQVLKDIGLPDSEKNRKYFEDVVFWD